MSDLVGAMSDYKQNSNFWRNFAIGLLMDQQFSLQESQQKATWAVHEATNCQEFLTLLQQIQKSKEILR